MLTDVQHDVVIVEICLYAYINESVCIIKKFMKKKLNQTGIWRNAACLVNLHT